MRPYIPYAILATLCIAFVLRFDRPQLPALAAARNVYDSTLTVVGEFAKNDPRIGFASPDEADSIWFDFKHPLHMRYIEEDSLIASGAPAEVGILPMHRVMYGVFTMVNGNPKLCACVTFDSVGGLHPITIEDSSVMIPYYEWIHVNPDTLKWYSYSLVQCPFLHTNLTIAHSNTGDRVLAPHELRTILGSDYPVAADSGDRAVEKGIMFSAIVKHQRRRHGL